MKKTGLFLMIAVGCSVSFLLTGCATKGMMKQDPKKLEAHCKDEKFKDAPICKYLSKRDKYDERLVVELYRVRDIGLDLQDLGQQWWVKAKAFSDLWRTCQLTRADAAEKHDEELMKLGALKK